MSKQGKKHDKLLESMKKYSECDELACRYNFHGKRKVSHSRGKKSAANRRAEIKRQLELALLHERLDELRTLARRIARWAPDEAEKLMLDASMLLEKADMCHSKPKESGFMTKRSVSCPVCRPALHPVFRPKVPWPSAPKVCSAYVDPIVEQSHARARALAEQLKDAEVNFMGGVSYRVNPLDTMKMITASSIFGEPQYYRDGSSADATLLNGRYGSDYVFARYCLARMDSFRGMDTATLMEKAIEEALDCDYAGTLDWAVELRTRYNMRLNPQIILVRAAMHPGRVQFTREHPGIFSAIEQRVMARGDDVSTQIRYCLAFNGSKRGIPAVLKRAWAKRISCMDAYSMAKYQYRGIGMIDAVRICHAKGPLVDMLMREGSLSMPEGENTWERLRAAGKDWSEILTEIRMPHMALLRNLRGIFSEVSDPVLREETLALLKRGVRGGRQFPFRYYSAWQAIEQERCPWAHNVQLALEECMRISCENLPKLPGHCAFLSDNSGSAWGTCTSEYVTMQIASIGNLSAVVGAFCAQAGVVFSFGDRLISFPVNREEDILPQLQRLNAVGKDCGMATENGVWLFFRDAILERQHWDSIFIYSDMQAGHGGLYGTNPEDYSAIGCSVGGRMIDVAALVELYRQQVNPKVNVYCIQIAGYTNALVPEYGYRTSVLYGWTGKELIFADAMRRTWDELEHRENDNN